MKLKKLSSADETLLLAKIKAGMIKQIHLIGHKTIFKPRGSMKKNSLGEYLFEKLNDHFDCYTDPKFEGNPELDDLLQTMYTNMLLEVTAAWSKFITSEKVFDAKE